MANPTTYFGWVMPNSADLVTDLPADFNVFGQGVDTSMSQLLGGTTGQVLSKTSGTNMAFTWVTPTDQTPLTTKGDLFTFSTVDARLPVGTDAQTLVADSTASTGLKWATPSAPTFSGVYCRNSASQSVANNTSTAITLDTEIYDVGGYHSNVTNNTRFTIPSGKAGYYQINFGGYYALNGTGSRFLQLYKNGAAIMTNTIAGNSSVYVTLNTAYTDYLNVGDYIEFFTAQSSGGSLAIDVTTGGGAGYAQMFLIGA